MKKLLLLNILLLMMVSLSSCSGDDNPSEQAVIFDIVCLERVTDAGSVFTLSKPSADEIITLQAPQRIDTRLVPEGDRLLIMYVPDGGVAYRSGPVTVKGYGLIVNGTLAETEGESVDGWDRDPVYLLSAWRAGKYLNLHARLPYDENPRAFTLAMPRIQADRSYPDIYLEHALAADVTTFSRAYYASFDISRLIDDPDVKGFTLHLNNSNLDLNEIRFDK